MQKISKIDLYQDTKTGLFYAFGKDRKGNIVKYTKKGYKTQLGAIKGF